MNLEKSTLPIRGFFPLDPNAKKPTRGTVRSAGYDFYANETVVLDAFETKLVGTGVTAYMMDDEVLKLYIRSSMALKQGQILKNAVGIIDADYYGNEIKIMVKNDTPYKVKIQKGDRIAQGVFQKYLTADGGEATAERIGGFGSTGAN